MSVAQQQHPRGRLGRRHQSQGEHEVSEMPTNPGYVAAEARIFAGYALSPTVHSRSHCRVCDCAWWRSAPGSRWCSCMASATAPRTGRRS